MFAAHEVEEICRIGAIENSKGRVEPDRAIERRLGLSGDHAVGSSDQCLAEIMAALQVSDFDTVRKRAHSLKGASANIHALGLSQAASSLEEAVRENSIPAIGGLVADLTEKLEAVNAELRRTG